MADPGVKAKLDAVGLDAWSGSASDLQKSVKHDFEAYGEVAKKVKIEVD